jgi:hypothetical protein
MAVNATGVFFGISSTRGSKSPGSGHRDHRLREAVDAGRRRSAEGTSARVAARSQRWPDWYESARAGRDAAFEELRAAEKGDQAPNTSAVSDMRKKCDKAHKDLSEAETALADAAIEKNKTFLSKMAHSAKMDVVGLLYIVQQVAQNPHAQFIREILTHSGLQAAGAKVDESNPKQTATREFRTRTMSN